MRIKIVVFDMDGVLVDIDSSWQFVHRAFNVNNQQNLKKYLDGEIDYVEFMKRDITLWGNPHIDSVRSILDKVQLMQGAKPTVTRLREAGYTTAILSAGISVLADRVQEQLGIHYVFANKIVVDEHGMVTGEGKEVVNLLKKTEVLRSLAAMEQTTPRCCAVVGDSVFDIPMFMEAGFSIAFNTNDKKVRETADVVVERKDLRGILPHLIGKRKRSSLSP